MKNPDSDKTPSSVRFCPDLLCSGLVKISLLLLFFLGLSARQPTIKSYRSTRLPVQMWCNGYIKQRRIEILKNKYLKTVDSSCLFLRPHLDRVFNVSNHPQSSFYGDAHVFLPTLRLSTLHSFVSVLHAYLQICRIR